MVNVIIPVYHSRKTLPKTLDSLVAQTKDKFLVTIIQDGDEEDYTDIVEEYRRRGLYIGIFAMKKNGGPGMARQYGIDMTNLCDYVMLLDSDDMLYPRAIEILYKECKKNDLDVIASNFLVEQNDGNSILFDVNKIPVTWCLGKMYKLDYLRRNKIKFLKGITLNEDSYFNLVAFNGTKKKGKIAECTGVWRSNKESLTRKKEEGLKSFFERGNHQYVYGQIRGLKKIYEVAGEIPSKLIGATIVNIYHSMMKELYYNTGNYFYLEELYSLKEFKPVQDYFKESDNWLEISKLIKSNEVDDGNLIFFKQRFIDWANEYILEDSE